MKTFDFGSVKVQSMINLDNVEYLPVIYRFCESLRITLPSSSFTLKEIRTDQLQLKLNRKNIKFFINNFVNRIAELIGKKFSGQNQFYIGADEHLRKKKVVLPGKCLIHDETGKELELENIIEFTKIKCIVEIPYLTVIDGNFTPRFQIVSCLVY